MSDDEQAKEVAAVMKQQDDALPAELEAYLRGTLSEAERRELEARAAGDPDLASALELFAPVSPGVLTRMGVSAAPKAAGPEPAAPEPAPHEPAAPRGRGEVVPLSSARRWTALGVALATAAALLIGLFGIGDPARPVPAFTLEATVGDARWRGEGDRAPTVRADSEVELRLIPEYAVDGAIEGRLYVLRDGQLIRRDVDAEVSGDGAVRWRGRADALTGTSSGSVTLILLAGRPRALPRDPSPSNPLAGEGFGGARVALDVRPERP